jgi:PPM family protein phosphatase
MGVAPALPLQAAFCSDPGRVRTNNEDVPIVDSVHGVYGVVDGVGGHAAGEIAASLASDVILQRLARPLGTPAERVREAIAIANNEIFRRADELPELHGMACVVTLALVADGRITVGHVGDSRLYLFRANGMQKLTHDHSPVGEREDAREITEIEAMRHPRRNEVFRDVGSAYHDKDDDDFVEVIEREFADDCAILLCTDGLTDMLPSASINRIVRRHAGRPQEVVDALVAAANEAGGKDNVTVVYAEAPGFATAVRSSVRDNMTSLEETPAVPPAANRDHRPNGTPAAGMHMGRLLLGIIRSRTVWFALGALAGVGALLLVSRWTGVRPGGPRTLVVGGAAGAFARISDAAAGAALGDVIRVEPGIYRERIDLPDGVDLIARVPGTVTIATPVGALGESVGLTVQGDSAARISGIRVESTAGAPLDIGMRISGQGRTIQLVELSGPMHAGIDVLPAATAAILGSQFTVEGPALMFAERAHAAVTSCTFVGRADSDPPVWVFPSAEVTFTHNVFTGFGPEVVRGLTAEAQRQFRATNSITSSEPAARR